MKTRLGGNGAASHETVPTYSVPLSFLTNISVPSAIAAIAAAEVVLFTASVLCFVLASASAAMVVRMTVCQR